MDKPVAVKPLTAAELDALERLRADALVPSRSGYIPLVAYSPFGRAAWDAMPALIVAARGHAQAVDVAADRGVMIATLETEASSLKGAIDDLARERDALMVRVTELEGQVSRLERRVTVMQPIVDADPALRDALLALATPATWSADQKPCWCGSVEPPSEHTDYCLQARRALGLEVTL